MAERALTPATIPQTYAELRDAVLAVVVKGRRAIDLAWVLSYHEIGRLINVHVLLHQERADYGARTYFHLAADTGISKRTLQECAQLGWAKGRLLCQVSDTRQRATLLAQAIKNNWTVLELQPRVRAINAIAIESAGSNASDPAAAAGHVELLAPQRGTPGLHPIVDRGEGPAVDLGFKLYWPLNAEQARRFSKGDIVRIASDDSIRRADDATKTDLFTYVATLRRVIDGDTLVVALEVSPGVFIEQKLRLHGLDCPEMKTPEGPVAKRFVEALVAKTTAVTINTSKPDKYDRYLADVFLTTESGEVFLNNALLENGQAVRKDAWEFGDWEPEWIG